MALSLGVDIAFAISFASVQLFLLYRVLEKAAYYYDSVVLPHPAPREKPKQA